MREIKFKAWDKKRKEIFNVGDIFLDLKGRLYLDKCDKPDYWKDRFILMQYTGLKDKNGREIYEGDIVKCFAESTGGLIIGHPLCNPFVRKILWDNKGAQFFMEDNCGESYRMTEDEPFEVIGNIYKNGDLLKRRQNES